MNIKRLLVRIYRTFVPYKMNSEVSIDVLAKRIKKRYKQSFGFEPNLENPILFSEKHQWSKLYNEDPRIPRIIDKVTFKEWIAEKTGNPLLTAKLFYVWHSPDEVSLNKIPKQCVIKSNGASCGEFIKIIRNSDEEDLEWLERDIKRRWFDKRNLLIGTSYDRQYHKLTPVVFVEELLGDEKTPLIDYKLFCFGGVPKFFFAVDEANRDSKGKPRSSFYTPEWEIMEVRYENRQPNHAPAPRNLAEMLRLGALLSSEFPFVRVDFCEVGEELYLSELTWYPTGAWAPLEQKEYDELWGSWYDLSKIKTSNN